MIELQQNSRYYKMNQKAHRHEKKLTRIQEFCISNMKIIFLNIEGNLLKSEIY